MNEFHRYVLSIFVNIYNTDAEKFTSYYEILGLITAYYQQTNTPITTDDIYRAVKYLIDIGFLEVADASSYRLSLTGKMYWDYNLTESNNLSSEIKRVKGIANIALLISLFSLAVLLFERLR